MILLFHVSLYSYEYFVLASENYKREKKSKKVERKIYNEDKIVKVRAFLVYLKIFVFL